MRPAPRPRPGRPEPDPSLLVRIDALGRAAAPGLLAALLMVLAAAPVGLPGLVAAVALPAVFFWSVFRPAVMPPPAAFCLGLLHDLLTLAPPGVGALTLLLAHGFALRWRRGLARRSFPVVWLAFCGFAAAAAALGWLLQVVLTLRATPAAPGLHIALATAGLYPVLAWPLTRLHEAIGRAEAAS
jgi:rod shape-determining protein MreD